MSNLFVRKATGMVRSWSVFDAFVYAFFSINLVTLGLYIFSQMYFFEGGMINALLVSAFFLVFEIIVYASLISVMPRAGGDYVWMTRIFGGATGFILAMTGWWFTLWLWVPLYGDMLRHIVITPILGLLGATSTALWFGQTEIGLFVTTLITVALATLTVILGMKTYARIQKFSFYAGMLGFLIVLVLLFTGSPDAFKAGLEKYAVGTFGAQPGVYDAVVTAGTDAGAITPLFGGNLNAVFLLLPYLVFFNLFPNWGATLYGEVRGATDYKRNFAGMAWGLGVTTVLAILFFLGINNAIGWDFYMQANGSWWNSVWFGAESPLTFWPYPALFAAFLTDSTLVQLLIIVLMSFWWFGWVGTVFLSSTRVIFAAAFDRLLPESASELNSNGTPVNAILLMAVPAVIVSYLFAFNEAGFRSLTLFGTLVIAVMYLGTSIAAMVLPYTKKDLFEASPIAQMKLAGIPLISIAGAIFSGFALYLLYQWILDPNALYGIGYSINPNGYKNGTSMVLMFVFYVGAAGVYYYFKSKRKSEGIDLDKVTAEIPSE
jgi:basic amino acid/polyamine antiporter, APA family